MEGLDFDELGPISTQTISPSIAILLCMRTLSRYTALCTGVLGIYLLSVLSALSQSKASLRGTISVLNTPVKGVTVRIFSFERVRETRSDDAGHFEFTDVTSDTYDLEASGYGWHTAIIEGLQVAGQNIELAPITLTLGQGDGRCIYALLGKVATLESVSYENKSDEANLIGIVFDPSGKPVSNAKVSLSTTPSRVTVTNAKGEFRFVGLVSGKYKLSVSHEGYTNEARTLHIAQRNLTRVNVVTASDRACG
jgi:hypothetical protein